MIDCDVIYAKSNRFPQVKTKADFVRRYQAGEFGNRSPTWQTVEEFLDNSYSSRLYHLRNKVAGGETHYNLTRSITSLMWKEKPEPNQWYVSEMAPHTHNLIQGELMQTDSGLYLYCSRMIYKPMRDALKAKPEQFCGIMASQLLRHYLDPISYDWIQTLLDRYPGHVIEFSTFDKSWGTIPGLNTVIWEVRLY